MEKALQSQGEGNVIDTEQPVVWASHLGTRGTQANWEEFEGKQSPPWGAGGQQSPSRNNVQV